MQDLHDIKADVKEIKKDLKEVAVTLVKNTTSLEHHMQRTAANETRIQKVENWVLGLLTAVTVTGVGAILKRLLD